MSSEGLCICCVRASKATVWRSLLRRYDHAVLCAASAFFEVQSSALEGYGRCCLEGYMIGGMEASVDGGGLVEVE